MDTYKCKNYIHYYKINKVPPYSDIITGNSSNKCYLDLIRGYHSQKGR